MKRNWRQFAGGIALALALRAEGAVFYVDVNSGSPTPPYTNWVTAATNIQSAIDAATNGDLVLVTNGAYQTGGRVVYGALTNRVAVNKALTVQSVNGPGLTAIWGNRDDSFASNCVRCVYMTNGGVLCGFTLTNGCAPYPVGYDLNSRGGGVWCESANALVCNCIITGNKAGALGGGAYSGTLTNCLLTNNLCLGQYAWGGGGAGSSVLQACTLTSNLTVGSGGGACWGI